MVSPDCIRPSGRVRIETPLAAGGLHDDANHCIRPSGRVRIETRGTVDDEQLRYVLHPAFWPGED